MSINEQSICLKTRNGKFANEKANNVQAVIDEILKPEKIDKPLVIWFHGGLVSTSAGENIASILTPRLESKGVNAVFFIWESGPVKEILDAVVSLARRKLGSGLLDILTKFLQAKTSYQPALGMTFSDDDKYELNEAEQSILIEAVEAHPDLRAEAAWIAGGSIRRQELGLATIGGGSTKADRMVEDKLKRYFETERSQHDPNKVLSGFAIGNLLTTALAPFLIDVAKNCLKRMRSNRDHGIQDTIIEEALRKIEIGKETWDQMKQDIDEAFGNNELAGGTLFIQGLKEAITKSPSRRILLVGHSAGAVYVAKFLDACANAQLSFPFDVRFLAPAARFDLFQAMLEQRKSSIKSIRLFGMKDQFEHEEPLLESAPLIGSVPLLKDLYKGSLLYLVSGALEAETDCPLIGMQRFCDPQPWMSDSEQQQITVIKANLPADEFIWSVTKGSVPGKQSEATTHSGFAFDLKTLESLLV
jgi:hypothetical protein